MQLTFSLVNVLTLDKFHSAMKEGVTTSGEQSAPPEFISTHPSHDRRISQFDDWMPSATRTFEGDDFGDRCRRVRDDMAAARRLAAAQAAQREKVGGRTL